MRALMGSTQRIINVRAEDGVREAHQATQLLDSSIYGIVEPSPLAGYVAYPKWDHHAERRGKNFLPKDVAYVAVPDLYWLYRLLSHGSARYQQDQRGEIPNLHRSLHHLHELHGLLLAKDESKRFEELIEEIKLEVTEVVTFLNPKAINRQKRRAIHLAVAVASGKDSYDRFNPGAFAARIVAAITAVQVRESDAISINAIFAQWRQIVQSVLCLFEYQVEVQYTFLEKVLADWESLVATRKNALVARLERYAKDVLNYDLNPFRQTFQYVSEEMRLAARALDADEFAKAQRLLQTSKNSLALRKIRAQLEKAMLLVSRKYHFPDASFEASAVVQIIRENASELINLETRYMNDFDKKVVLIGLQDVASDLEVEFDPSLPKDERKVQPRIYGRFRQTIRLI